MENQVSQLSAKQPLPERKYLVKRIEAEDIEISETERNHIVTLLEKVRAVQIGEYTVMVSNIRSIDPKFGAGNIPPRPKPLFPVTAYELDGQGRKCIRDENFNLKVIKASNQDEIDQWDEWYGRKQLQ